MARQAFTFNDIAADCEVATWCYQLDGKPLGAKVEVPRDLQDHYPYNASAYVLLQELRAAIHQYGTVEFPGLPLNRTNHTVAMGHPYQHSYSDNPYLTRFCQDPHQDTPPYPTAFWLQDKRRYSATWLMSVLGLEQYLAFEQRNRGLNTEAIHRQLLPRALEAGSALLVNHEPGLILIDNSNHHQLYHCRTSNFFAMDAEPAHSEDALMYSFNEVGLLNYIDVLDSRRGQQHRDAADLAEVRQFLAREQA